MKRSRPTVSCVSLGRWTLNRAQVELATVIHWALTDKVPVREREPLQGTSKSFKEAARF